ncbi:PH domain-containing protein [Candidatus Saccharibacteria bacterium]|nr:PH domain-containing protein [Candidatus Saccharibacteria bacterium]
MSTTLTDLRHARSAQDFPFLSLEDGEYVVLSIARSRLGLIFVWFSEIVGFLVLTLILLSFGSSSDSALAPATSFIRLIIFCLYGVLILTGVVGTKVYLDNKMYITNKRAIQISSNALFHKSTNIIELSRIEDVSYAQAGLLDYLFHMGTIRMSTVGDETTYTFRFVDTPTDEIKTITHLVHETKSSSQD